MNLLLPQSSNSDAELKKAADEIKRLREEISSLRMENLQMKVRHSVCYAAEARCLT